MICPSSWTKTFFPFWTCPDMLNIYANCNYNQMNVNDKMTAKRFCKPSMTSVLQINIDFPCLIELLRVYNIKNILAYLKMQFFDGNRFVFLFPFSFLFYFQFYSSPYIFPFHNVGFSKKVIIFKYVIWII